MIFDEPLLNRICFVSMKKLVALVLLILFYKFTYSQGNYEIQVYESPTMAKNYTMIEMHSNITLNGSTMLQQGSLPTNGVEHETIEITHGFTDWFETGFYFFNSIANDGRTAYVGSHIRPRVMLPEKYHFPVGLSLSLEVGYQKRRFSPDDWTFEIRPIIDKKVNKWYFDFNPVFDKSFHGVNETYGYDFSPNVKVSYDVTKVWAAGIEYYGEIGEINNVFPYSQQGQNLFVALDADFAPDWEFNIGYGIALNNTTDNEILKCILGWSFSNKKKKAVK